MSLGNVFLPVSSGKVSLLVSCVSKLRDISMSLPL